MTIIHPLIIEEMYSMQESNNRYDNEVLQMIQNNIETIEMNNGTKLTRREVKIVAIYATKLIRAKKIKFKHVLQANITQTRNPTRVRRVLILSH